MDHLLSKEIGKGITTPFSKSAVKLIKIKSWEISHPGRFLSPCLYHNSVSLVKDDLLITTQLLQLLTKITRFLPSQKLSKIIKISLNSSLAYLVLVNIYFDIDKYTFISSKLEKSLF